MPTVVFQPGPADGYDTYIDEANPDTNHETSIGLGIESPTPNREMAFINFFLASIPVGSIVTSATLTVRVGTVTADNRFFLYKVVDAWYVDTLTWNNRPIPATTPIIKEASSVSFLDFDVTEMVQEWVNNPLWNLGVQISGALCPDVYTDIYSSNYLDYPEWRPKLSVTYEPPAAGEQAARIYLASAGKTIPSGVSTIVPLDTKYIGNDYIIDLVNYRIYPIEPGYYICLATVSFSNIAGVCVVTTEIKKNGITIGLGYPTNIGAWQVQTGVALVYCDGVNDYIQLYTYQDNGVARTLVNLLQYTSLSVSKTG